MYVLIVFNNYDDSDIDAVLGPFNSYQDAGTQRMRLFGAKYRRTSIVKVEDKLPDWAT